MFNWFRSKKKKENEKQFNNNSSNSGAIVPIILSSGLDDKDKKHTCDHSSISDSVGSDYSNGANFDSSGSDGGGGSY